MIEEDVRSIIGCNWEDRKDARRYWLPFLLKILLPPCSLSLLSPLFLSLPAPLSFFFPLFLSHYLCCLSPWEIQDHLSLPRTYLLTKWMLLSHGLFGDYTGDSSQSSTAPTRVSAGHKIPLPRHTMKAEQNPGSPWGPHLKRHLWKCTAGRG